MSAKIGTSSSAASSKNACLVSIKPFSFDPLLLQTKVYHRALESSWRREVTIDGEEVEQTPSDSRSSHSSNGAITSQSSRCAVDPLVSCREDVRNSISHFDQVGGILHPEIQHSMVSERQDLQRINVIPAPEALTGVTTRDTTSSSITAESTVATTTSSVGQSMINDEPVSRSRSNFDTSKAPYQIIHDFISEKGTKTSFGSSSQNSVIAWASIVALAAVALKSNEVLLGPSATSKVRTEMLEPCEMSSCL